MKVYIIIWAEGIIESVWSQRQLAVEAIQQHADASRRKPSFYRIIVREVDQLRYEKQADETSGD